MSFSAPKTQPNGSQSAVHKIARIEIVAGIPTATVNSYATAAQLDATQPMLNWQDTYSIPLGHIAAPETWLISPEGPFAGGALIVPAEPLETAKARKWTALKQRRDELETAGFPYLGKTFDSDSRSVQRITTTVLAAQAVTASGEPFSIDWTTADNSIITLDGPQMLGVPVALAVYGGGLHATATELRLAIEAATTEAEVSAVIWPI